MLSTLTITDLDNIRCETMMALLNKEGRGEIWKYDIITRPQAAREALANQNYDNIETAAKNKNKPFALVGPGIDDCYFETVAELISILFWVCQKCSGNGVKVEDTYSNQTEFMNEYKAKNFPFIPLKQY